jgi:Trp operon repressor
MEKIDKISLQQYQEIPTILEKSYSSDDGLMVLNHLLDRDDFLGDIEEVQKDLKIADEALKKALQNTSAKWQEALIEATKICGIKSEWWQNIVNSI